MKTKNDAIKALKLTSNVVENLIKRLQKLVIANGEIPTLAYEGTAENNFSFACRGCDGACKGSCSGGCTSW